MKKWDSMRPVRLWSLRFLLPWFMVACAAPEGPSFVEVYVPAATEMPAWAVQTTEPDTTPEPAREWFLLQLRADDLEAPLMVTGMTGATVRLEVPSGTQRVFEIELYHRMEMELATHRGTSRPMDLVAGLETRVRIDVEPLSYPPTVQTVRLNEGDIYTTDELRAEVEGISDRLERPVDLRYAWLNDGVIIPGADAPILPGTFFSKYDAIQVRVTPVAGQDVGEPVLSETVTILNTPPTLAGATLGAGPFYGHEELRVTHVGASDPDGDTISFRHEWYINNVLSGASNTDRLDPIEYSRGDTVRVIVFPSDLESEGLPVETEEILITNAPPVVYDVIFPDGDPLYADSLLTASVTWGDPEGDPVSFLWEWHIDGVLVGDEMTSMPTAVFTPDSLEKHASVFVRVTPFDDDEGVPVDSAVAIVQNTPPSITGVDTAPGPYDTNSQLTVIPLGWDDIDGDAPGYRYEWFVNSTLVPGVNTETLDSIYFERGDMVFARVFPFDGEDEGAPHDSAIFTIDNAPPVIHSVGIAEGPRNRLSGLTAEFDASDPDGGPLVYTFQWFVNGDLLWGGTVLPGMDPPTLDGEDVFRGDEVVITVTVEDDFGATDGPVTSSPVTVQNSPPGSPEIALTPESLTLLSDSLQTSIVVEADDMDGDGVTYSYAWYHNGIALDWPDENTIYFGDLPEVQLEAADWIQVVVTPHDGFADGATAFTQVMVDTAGRIFLGFHHSCGVIGDGPAQCWGVNESGQLGDGTTTSTLSPVDILSSELTPLEDAAFFATNNFTEVISFEPTVYADRAHSCAVMRDTSVKCWGSNAYGQLGDGTTTDRPYPADVLEQGGLPLTGAIAITAGYGYTCVLLETGGAMCWGYNAFGTLGNGGSQDQLNPVDVLDPDSGLPLTGISAIGARYRHTCALLGADGSVLCWGKNQYGALGNGNTTTQYSPDPVLDPQGTEPLTGATTLHVGHRQTCVTMSDGTARCWGQNDQGQLGNGQGALQAVSSLPQIVLANAEGDPLTAVRSVQIGTRHACALRDDDGIQCWGSSDANGMLGTGADYASEPYPVDVLEAPGGTPLSGVLGMYMGRNHTCAVLKTEPLACWGRNDLGQLGDGTTTSRNVPVVIP